MPALQIPVDKHHILHYMDAAAPKCRVNKGPYIMFDTCCLQKVTGRRARKGLLLSDSVAGTRCWQNVVLSRADRWSRTNSRKVRCRMTSNEV